MASRDRSRQPFLKRSFIHEVLNRVQLFPQQNNGHPRDTFPYQQLSKLYISTPTKPTARILQNFNVIDKKTRNNVRNPIYIAMSRFFIAHALNVNGVEKKLEAELRKIRFRSLNSVAITRRLSSRSRLNSC